MEGTPVMQSPNHPASANHGNTGLNSTILGSLGRDTIGGYLANGSITPSPRVLPLGLSRNITTQILPTTDAPDVNSGSVEQSSILSSLWTRKRPRGSDSDDAKRGRLGSVGKGEHRQSKGLRHFSWKVCEKVRQKQSTTYNEVADELVRELSETGEFEKGKDPVDHKNIRRRVYDALNVLMAMNIIKKERKDITWIGLPTNSSHECQKIEDELQDCQQRITQKKEEAKELLLQVLSFKNLMRRNKDRLATQGSPAANSSINLPFIIVSTNKKTTIDCSISSDKTEYHFTFDNVFEICDDVQVLKKLGLTLGLDDGTCSSEDLHLAKELMPKSLEGLLEEMASSSQESSQTITTPISSPIALRQVGTGNSLDPLSPVVGSSMAYPSSPLAAPLSKVSPGLPSANSTPNKRVIATSLFSGQSLSSPLNLVSKATGSPLGVKAQVISSVRENPTTSTLSPIAPNNTSSNQQILSAQLLQLMNQDLSPAVLQKLSQIPLGKLNLSSILHSAAAAGGSGAHNSTATGSGANQQTPGTSSSTTSIVSDNSS